MTTIVRAIEFENNLRKVCYSGQSLKGQVIIYFPFDTHVKAIYVTFCGKGFCQWDNGVSTIGSIIYLDERRDFLSHSSGGWYIPFDASEPNFRNITNFFFGFDSTIVRAGYSKYPFEIELRHTLPTSYEGTHGYIRYITSLHIDCSARKIHPLEESFTVIKPFNLDNSSESYQAPVSVRKYVKFRPYCCLFCWKTDDLKIFGRLPVRGYCPGQIMNLKLDVINESSQEILYFRIRFVQEVTYTANNGKQKVERIVLTDKQTEGCRADHSGRQTVKVNTLVPSLPPTNFSTNVCGSRYKFVVTAKTPMFYENPKFEIPIVIGTYPISNELYSTSHSTDYQGSLTSIPPTALQLDDYLNASGTSIEYSDLPPYPDEDPPSYEEAMRSNLATKESFVPKYPTYRRQMSYASEEP